jgi:chaperone BCS1
MDDTALNTLINSIPTRAIILMEDIDAAFTQSVTREPDPVAPAPQQYGVAIPPPPPPSNITLSGLLNAIDGVQAQQGRLLFATTNKYDALDPALMRPGRLDLHIEFKQATKWQAAELFKRFYPEEKDTGRTLSLGSSGETTAERLGVGEKRDEVPPSPIVENDEDLSGVQRVSTHGPSASQRKSRKAPKLTNQELEDLAHQFSDAIPEEELSMAYVVLRSDFPLSLLVLVLNLCFRFRFFPLL